MTEFIGWPGVPAVALGAVLAMGTLLWLLSLRLVAGVHRPRAGWRVGRSRLEICADGAR